MRNTCWHFESRKLRQWFRCLCYFFKIQPSSLPQYLNTYLNRHYVIQHVFHLFQILKQELNFLEFRFLYTVNEWNNLDDIIKSSESYLTFRKRMLKLIRPDCNDTYGVHNPTGLKLQTRLRLDLSNLNDHKFNHNFKSFMTEVDII